jgi:hypothetical protein
MIDDDKTVTYPVPAQQWEDYIAAFSENLDQKPVIISPGVAEFSLSGKAKLRVIQVADTQLLAKEIVYSSVANEEYVGLISSILKGKTPYKIQVLASKNSAPANYTLTMATYKIKKRDTAGSDDPSQDGNPNSSDVSSTQDTPITITAELEGGVIHNPPQATLVEEQPSITEQTDER